jgi:hypothetical protein
MPACKSHEFSKKALEMIVGGTTHRAQCITCKEPFDKAQLEEMGKVKKTVDEVK